LRKVQDPIRLRRRFLTSGCSSRLAKCSKQIACCFVIPFVWIVSAPVYGMIVPNVFAGALSTHRKHQLCVQPLELDGWVVVHLVARQRRKVTAVGQVEVSLTPRRKERPTKKSCSGAFCCNRRFTTYFADRAQCHSRALVAESSYLWAALANHRSGCPIR